MKIVSRSDLNETKTLFIYTNFSQSWLFLLLFLQRATRVNWTRSNRLVYNCCFSSSFRERRGVGPFKKMNLGDPFAGRIGGVRPSNTSASRGSAPSVRLSTDLIAIDNWGASHILRPRHHIYENKFSRVGFLATCRMAALTLFSSCQASAEQNARTALFPESYISYRGMNPTDETII